MSIECNFSGESYEFDNVNVNINGTIYYVANNRSCYFFEELLNNPLNLIEEAVHKFVRMLSNIIDMEVDTIDFFGDVKVIGNNIETYPAYFILSGNRCGVYKIDSRDVTNISLILSCNHFDEAIDCLYNIDCSLVDNCRGNYNAQDDFKENIEDDLDGDMNGYYR